MKNYILKSLVCLQALLYLTSCASQFYHQVATFSSEDAKLQKDQYIAENDIILTAFISEFRSENETNIQEDENQFIMELKIKNENNKYTK